MVTCDRLRGGARVIQKPMKSQTQMVCLSNDLRPFKYGKIDNRKLASFIGLAMLCLSNCVSSDSDNMLF